MAAVSVNAERDSRRRLRAGFAVPPGPVRVPGTRGCPNRGAYAAAGRVVRHGLIGRRGGPAAGEEALERRVARAPRRAELAPGALLRVLVVAEAEKARPVAKAVALHLVVAHFGDKLRLHRRLLELACAPAVRFREAPVRFCVDERENALGDLLVAGGGYRGGADVVEPAVVAVETEQERRDPVRLRLPAQANDDGVRRLVRLHLHDCLAGAGPVRLVDPLGNHAVEAGGLECVEPFLGAGGVAGAG